MSGLYQYGPVSPLYVDAGCPTQCYSNNEYAPINEYYAANPIPASTAVRIYNTPIQVDADYQTSGPSLDVNAAAQAAQQAAVAAAQAASQVAQAAGATPAQAQQIAAAAANNAAQGVVSQYIRRRRF
jgi:hypothetical protein